MKPCLPLLAVLWALAACGVDGKPTPPATNPSVAISGEVQIGVSG